MYCRQCGFNNDKYSKMCKRCGSDLRRPVEEYTPGPSEPGKLRFAPKEESLADMFKRRFRRLERVALDRSNRKPMIIAAVCVVLLLTALIAVPRIRACMIVEPDTYGSTAGNTATGNPAAIDGDFLYCSQPVGDNPGLYRMKMSTGELLKISWHTMSQMSWYDGWLYGVNEDGLFMRISSDGMREQQVLPEDNISHISIFNGSVYYLDPYGSMLRASLDEVDDNTPAQPQIISDAQACEMLLFDGMIYYIQQTGYCYEPGVPMDDVLDPDYEPGKISWITGKEIPPKYKVVAARAEKPMGHIYRMMPDGTGAELLVDEEVCNLSAHGDYLYYMTQTAHEVSAAEFDPNAPANITIRGSSCQFWRFNLVTMKYTRFLDEGTSRSPLNVTDQAICFVSVNGDLETCPVTGGDHVLLPTEAQNVESFAVLNGTAYFSADGGTRVGWIKLGEKVPVTLWEARWDQVVFPENSAGEAVSGSDAA